MTLNPITPFAQIFRHLHVWCLPLSAAVAQARPNGKNNQTRLAIRHVHPRLAIRHKHGRNTNNICTDCCPALLLPQPQGIAVVWASHCRHLPPFRHFAYPQKGVTGILQQIARVCGHLASISVWRWLVQNSRACARCLRSCSCLCERMISVFVQHRHAGGPRVTQRCSLRGVSRILTPKTAGSMRSANMLCSDAAYASARF